jgi:hypothetical protein
MSTEIPYDTRKSFENQHLPEQMSDDDENDEFFDDISESLEYIGEGLGKLGNLSALSSDDRDFAVISPGDGLPSATSSGNGQDHDHGYLRIKKHQENGGGRYFHRNSGEKTPMATNCSFRLESGTHFFQDEEKGDSRSTQVNFDEKQTDGHALGDNGPKLFPSRLPVYGDSSEDEGDPTLEDDEEGSQSLRDREPSPPSPDHKMPSSSSSTAKNTSPLPRKSRNSVSTDDSDVTRSPTTPRLSQQQEMQRQQLHHLMMTPVGLQMAEEFAESDQNVQNLSHLMMTMTMSGTRDVGFRPYSSLPLRSPAATSTSLSYSTDLSREHDRSGNPDPESSVSFASPVPSYAQERPRNQPQQDSIWRLSSHTGESVNSQSGAITFQSETTRYHSGVEREFRKEAFRRNQSTPNRDGEEVDAASSDGSESTLEPMIVCGITCSMWFTRLVNNPFSLYQISLGIVQYAPCFWFCCCSKSDLQGSASSDRFILARLNTISFFFTMMQLVAASWLATVLFWITGEGAAGAFSPHWWNCNGAVFSVGLIGAVIMIMCFCTVRIIKEVDLMGAIRYLWALLWIFPVEIFFNITLFDYHRVTEVWVVHWWGVNQLSWFRDKYCLDGTANTLCLVPINGGPDYATEDGWCQALYNATDCSYIRDDAQKATTYWLLMFYTSLATWGCIFLFLVLLVINTLERIISKPIVQKSRETNVPGWLTFPTIGTALVGTVFLFSHSSLLRTLKEHNWVGMMYTITSGLFFIALLMGCCLSSYSVRSNVDKRRKGTAVMVFIGVLAVNASLLATLFVTSIAWSTQVKLNSSQRGDIACLINNNDCTNCDAELAADKCPEWSVADVTAILQTQLKQSASLAAIFMLYAVNVMSYGINLRRHLSRYQIDYV